MEKLLADVSIETKIILGIIVCMWIVKQSFDLYEKVASKTKEKSNGNGNTSWYFTELGNKIAAENREIKQLLGQQKETLNNGHGIISDTHGLAKDNNFILTRNVEGRLANISEILNKVEKYANDLRNNQ